MGVLQAHGVEQSLALTARHPEANAIRHLGVIILVGLTRSDNFIIVVKLVTIIAQQYHQENRQLARFANRIQICTGVIFAGLPPDTDVIDQMGRILLQSPAVS